MLLTKSSMEALPSALDAGLVQGRGEATVLSSVTHWPPSDTDLASGFHFKRKDRLITLPQALEEHPGALYICAQQRTDAMKVPHMWNTHGRAHQSFGSWGLD